MSDRIFEICARLIPRAQRTTHGAAVTDLAAEMVTSGRSSVAREAIGILRFGIRRRIPRRVNGVAALPWGESLWMLAAPVAAVQFALMLLAIRPETFSPDSIGAGSLGWWWSAMLIASGITALAALRRKRDLLGLGAGTMLALAILDTWGPGGSMLGDTSHGVDLGSSGWLLSPAVLFLMPSMALPLFAAFTAPPVPRPINFRLHLIGLCATIAAPAFAVLMTYGRLVSGGRLPESFLWIASGEQGYLNFVVLALGTGLLVTMLVQGTRRPAATLAGGILIASQIPLLTLIAMFDGFERFEGFFAAIPLPGPVVFVLTPVVIALTFAALLSAIVFIRFRFSAKLGDRST